MIQAPQVAEPTTGRMPTAPAVFSPLVFSIVIANFNYGRFIGRAIQSALDLDWPAVEIIVVDDGSTDHSADVIGSFGDRITAIFQQNGGQRAANNTGFASASGDVIVFLDADDILEPDLAREVAAVWRPGLSKVQVQMRRVDVDDCPFGSLIPPIVDAPEPEQVRAWANADTEYPTPPGSGNAYSRDFLSLFFPIGPEHDSWTDSTCLALAPILGDVVTVAKPLVRYRQHGSNDSNLLAVPGRFAREIARAITRQRSVELVLASLDRPSPAAGSLRRSRHLLQLRIASLRMQPEAHPLPGDSRLAAFGDAIRSVGGSSFYPVHRRALMAAWGMVTLLAPQTVARRLVSMRFGG